MIDFAEKHRPKTESKSRKRKTPFEIAVDALHNINDAVDGEEVDLDFRGTPDEINAAASIYLAAMLFDNNKLPDDVAKSRDILNSPDIGGDDLADYEVETFSERELINNIGFLKNAIRSQMQDLLKREDAKSGQRLRFKSGGAGDTVLLGNVLDKLTKLYDPGEQVNFYGSEDDPERPFPHLCIALSSVQKILDGLNQSLVADKSSHMDGGFSVN